MSEQCLGCGVETYVFVVGLIILCILPALCNDYYRQIRTNVIINPEGNISIFSWVSAVTMQNPTCRLKNSIMKICRLGLIQGMQSAEDGRVGSILPDDWCREKCSHDRFHILSILLSNEISSRLQATHSNSLIGGLSSDLLLLWVTNYYHVNIARHAMKMNYPILQYCVYYVDPLCVGINMYYCHSETTVQLLCGSVQLSSAFVW